MWRGQPQPLGAEVQGRGAPRDFDRCSEQLCGQLLQPSGDGQVQRWARVVGIEGAQMCTGQNVERTLCMYHGDHLIASLHVGRVTKRIQQMQQSNNATKNAASFKQHASEGQHLVLKWAKGYKIECHKCALCKLQRARFVYIMGRI